MKEEEKRCQVLKNGSIPHINESFNVNSLPIQKSAEALYNLALDYLNGNGVEVLQDRAIFYLREASKQDYTAAQLLLFRILLKENSEMSLQEGLRWLSRGAELGNPECQIDLGFIYQLDNKQSMARYWYQKAFSQGVAKAKWYLDRLPK